MWNNKRESYSTIYQETIKEVNMKPPQDVKCMNCNLDWIGCHCDAINETNDEWRDWVKSVGMEKLFKKHNETKVK